MSLRGSEDSNDLEEGNERPIVKLDKSKSAAMLVRNKTFLKLLDSEIKTMPTLEVSNLICFYIQFTIFVILGNYIHNIKKGRF